MIIKLLFGIGLIAFIVDYVAYFLDFHQGLEIVNLALIVVGLMILATLFVRFRRAQTRARYR